MKASSSLKKIVRFIYYNLLPNCLREKITEYRKPAKRALRDVLRYYRFRPNKTKAYRDELNFLRRHGFSYFPYPFVFEHSNCHVDVDYDETFGLPYVDSPCGRLFFPKEMIKESIIDYVRQIFCEQDAASPHRYLSSRFDVPPNSVVVDVGAAEGIFGLSVISKVDELILCEPNKTWIQPLEATFSPWKDRVRIIDKYIGASEDDHMTTIDRLSATKRIDFIKIDAEGFEEDILAGAQETIKKGVKKMAVSCYHRHKDREILTHKLQQLGYSIQYSEGTILYYHSDDWQPPYFRTALIKAAKDV